MRSELHKRQTLHDSAYRRRLEQANLLRQEKIDIQGLGEAITATYCLMCAETL